MSQYILAIDQGTTGSTALVLSTQGQVLGKANQEYRQIFPKPGWVEHDPEDIWQSVLGAIRSALDQAGISPGNIAAIGITNQRETTVLWDKTTGKSVYNAIVWQCRRTAPECQKLKKKGLEKKVKAKTGLVLDPYFSGTKIKWILDNVPAARELAKKGNLRFGNIDAFLLWRLTDGAAHATDPSNASRTLLMDLKKLSWDSELCKIFGVPQEILPEIKSNVEIFGTTKGVPGLPDGIPISGMAGDQQSALFGQACFEVGEAKCTYGTGSFLVLNTGNKIVTSRAGCLSTVAWRVGKKATYALEGSAFICGAAVQWLRDGLGLFSKSSEIEALARSVPDTGGVFMVPALAGLGAPYWDAEARGLISGLSRGSTKAHLARAVLEGMALQNVELANAMQKDLKKKLKVLKVDGGASQNNLLMQMQADFLGTVCIRPAQVETTGLGAAYLAGLGVGIWSDLSDIKKIWRKDRDFIPELKDGQRAAKLKEWQREIRRSRLR